MGEREDLEALRRLAELEAKAGTAPAQPAPKPEMGFFEGIVEQVTGTQRATPETQTLPEWTSIQELGSMSVASFKTAF
jgi:hypothetical protein